MAIKLYKSQLTPTTESSNVMNRNRVSMSEAASIGNAWKGMVKSGELLYAKHQDIKTDNEILEKSKEVMNGGENYTGLSETTLNASQMKDPDAAGKLYNDEWQKIFDNVNGSLSGKQAQRKFKSFMTKQNLKDVNAIKTASTTNMINSLRVNKLDQIETLKKSVIYGHPTESTLASEELKILLADKKTSDIFGNTLEKVANQTNRDIAFYGYKNVPIDQRNVALGAAKKDKRLSVEDVEKLQSHFKTSSSTSTKLINSELTKMDEMATNGIMPELSVLDSYEATGEALDKQELVFKAQKLKAKIALVGSLNVMTPVQIESFITETQSNISMDTDGTSTVLYDQLKTAKDYLAKLNTDLEKDPIAAVSKRGTFKIETIDFQEFSTDIKSNYETFKDAMINRKSQAESIGTIYGVKNKFLSEAEATQITSVLNKMDNPEQIRFLSQVLVDGFGGAAPDVFAQLQEKDAFLAHIGGLSIVSEGRENKAIDLAIEGHLLNKNENIDIKVKDTDKAALIAKYKDVFPENIETLNNIIGTADNIYSAMYFGTSKYKTGIFDKKMYEKAMEMSLGKNGNYGGVAEYNDHNVHVPMYLKNNEFTDFVDWLKDNPDMLAKSSGTEIKGEDEFGGEFLPGDPVGKYNGKIRSIQIFENGEPFLISVGYGKFKVAMQDHPSDPNGDPRYVIDGNFAKKGNNFFIIDFNKVRSNWESR
jgi:hypothetical protein